VRRRRAGRPRPQWRVRDWPPEDVELVAVQAELGPRRAALVGSDPWRPSGPVLAGGCFVACGARAGEGEPAWAAAVTWPAPPPAEAGGAVRRDRLLRGSFGSPRRARDVVAQAVVTGTISAPYVPGLLALRHGPLLSRALLALEVRPEVVLVDGTGTDHPRRAGLAVHLGAVLEVPTVGVTHRALLAGGEAPEPVRGARRPAVLQGEVVGYWITTRTGARPVLAHAGWRTTPETAAEVVLQCSTESAHTPVPLQEARRVAREARAAARRVGP
jgi:deoxyribonuclease V